ncbi:hypothetical protein L3081_15385 [Colwellia sp. MSW7]|uniref:DUF1934 domain-containing protein n=1 Tax=Colwellia maritima TaxID=2912588 RepID=A0ABS9X2P7_9GAMM|nr:hypothetical protein [Colwellia maritima]MCI2284519.1 hypothetical protein [Colwellia maritima]
MSPTTQMNKAETKHSFVCIKSQSQCDVETVYGKFTIQFSGDANQTYIKTELPFHAQLTFDATNETYMLKSVSSYLEGKSMFMGKIPVFFEPSENQESNTRVAESLLASCSEEIMTWLFWFKVEILVDGIVQQQDFLIEFDSERL